MRALTLPWSHLASALPLREQMTSSHRRLNIRVARIIARLNVGGPAIHVSSLTGRLPADRFESRLYAGDVSDGEVEMVEALEREGVTPIRVPGLGRAIRGRRDALALGRIVSELRAFKPHIVHTHTAKAGALGRLAAVVLRVPIVVHTFHGHVFDGYFDPVRTRAFIGIERALARITSAIVTLSPRQRADIVEHYRINPRGEVHVIPLGFDLARFARAPALRGQLRRELGMRDEPIVAVIGRITDIKDHPLLLRAMALLEPTAHLVVVGGGEREPAIRELAQDLGIGGRSHFLGFRGDLDRVLADADVVALTSKNEGTPVALIEALAAGCSVVATAVGGVPDVLEEGRRGHVVGVRTPEAIAGALRGALSSHRRRPASEIEASRRYVLEKYGVARLVADHVRLYEQLVARAGLE